MSRWMKFFQLVAQLTSSDCNVGAKYDLWRWRVVAVHFIFTSEVRLRRGNLACSAKYGGQGVHVLFSEIKIKIQVHVEAIQI